MTAEQFAYWLQGFSEITSKVPTDVQWKIIQDHLQLVFKKVTPVYLNHNLLGPGSPGDLTPKC